MLKKSISLTFIFSLVILFGVTLVLSGPPSIDWDKVEGAANIQEYASDSGSFALMDGYEFTDIYVSASVENGDHTAEMSAIAHIQITSGPSAHAEAEANGSDSAQDGEYNLDGNGYEGCSWYWSVDTRNNDGVGSVECKWAWNIE